MKKITLFFVFAILGAFTFSTYAQTLDQPAGWPNAAWTLTGTDANAAPAILLANPTTTDSNFAFNDDAAGNGANNDVAAESPVIDLTAASGAGETWLTVSTTYVHRYLANDELVFQYYDADAATWTDWGSPLTTNTSGAPNNNFCSGTAVALTTDVLDIASFTATQLSGFRYRISYDDDPSGAADWNYGFCIQSPTITSATPPSCLDPTALTASNVLATSADLGWTETGTATLWNIELVDVTAGDSATGTATSTGVSNPFNQTGLTATNDYEFYVQADCGVDGTSNWVGPFSFTTTCAVEVAPYTEDFESFTVSTAAFTSGNCWSGSGGTFFWESAAGTDTSSGGTGPDPSITTGNYFFTEASSGAVGATTELTTVPVDLSALTVPALEFSYHMFGSQMGTLEVLVNGTVEFSISGQQQTAATQPFIEQLVNLSAYAGQTVQVVFKATKGSGFESDIAIDNVKFDELPDCPNPFSLTATNITIDSADLGWTENGSATLWNVELVDVTAGGVVTGTATSTGVSNPFSQTGLTQNNDYEFYVQADCGTDGTSAWVGPFAFTTAATPPDCATTPTPADGAVDVPVGDVTFTWEAPTTGPTPTSYDLYAGETTALEYGLVGNFTTESAALSITANDLLLYWQIVPLNADTPATGCPIWSFTTASPLTGALCEDPILVNALPFNETGNTNGFGDDYSSTNVTCSTSSYLGGDDIVYAYTPTTDQDVSVTLSGTGAWTGVFVFTGCDPAPDVFTGCVGNNTNSAGNPVIPSVSLTANTTYYIVISTWPTPQATAFTLDIKELIPNDECAGAIGIALATDVAFDNSGGTDSGVDSCYTGDVRDLWYSFVAPASGEIKITVGGSATQYSLFSDCTTEVSCGVDVNTVTAGNTYFVSVTDDGANLVPGASTVRVDDTATLSTTDFDSSLGFSYYPNPVKNTLTLNANKAITNVAVFNMLGQEVIRTAPNAVSNNVDMSNLQTGAYFVQITIGQAVETVRVIKN